MSGSHPPNRFGTDPHTSWRPEAHCLRS
jgi:hypothetical protein